MCSATLWQFAKRTQITFGAVAKGNRLDHFGCANRELHAIQILLFNDAERSVVKKICFSSAILKLIKAYPS
jgi:hypothetical protein